MPFLNSVLNRISYTSTRSQKECEINSDKLSNDDNRDTLSRIKFILLQMISYVIPIRNLQGIRITVNKNNQSDNSRPTECFDIEEGDPALDPRNPCLNFIDFKDKTNKYNNISSCKLPTQGNASTTGNSSNKYLQEYKTFIQKMNQANSIIRNSIHSHINTISRPITIDIENKQTANLQSINDIQSYFSTTLSRETSASITNNIKYLSIYMCKFHSNENYEIHVHVKDSYIVWSIHNKKTQEPTSQSPMFEISEAIHTI